MQVLITMNFSLKFAFAASHTLWYIVFTFSFVSRYTLIYLFLNCCSSTVVSIFTPSHSLTPPISTSHPRTYPLGLCPCVLYTCSLKDLPLFSPIIPLSPPLWLLSVCSLFQCLWLHFPCFFVLLIRFHL